MLFGIEIEDQRHSVVVKVDGPEEDIHHSPAVVLVVIEDRVVLECRKLLTDSNIEKISLAVAAACEADYDSSAIKRIKAAIQDADSGRLSRISLCRRSRSSSPGSSRRTVSLSEDIPPYLWNGRELFCCGRGYAVPVNGSNPGLGYYVDEERRFHVDPDGAVVVRDIFEMYASGKTVLFQLGLVDGAIIAVPGKAVKLIDKNALKNMLVAVSNHALELGPAVRCAANDRLKKAIVEMLEGVKE